MDIWDLQSFQGLLDDSTVAFPFLFQIFYQPLDISSQFLATCQKIISQWSVGKVFYFYLIIYYFLTGEKKVNSELDCPSINKLKREKTSN